MAELSPRTQAVLAAYLDGGLSAALQAAADQIRFGDQVGLTAYGGHAQAQCQLLAIAAELEGNHG
jgi:hypothetical protein